jgi:hypothetical protein
MPRIAGLIFARLVLENPGRRAIITLVHVDTE